LVVIRGQASGLSGSHTLLLCLVEHGCGALLIPVAIAADGNAERLFGPRFTDCSGFRQRNEFDLVAQNFLEMTRLSIRLGLFDPGRIQRFITSKGTAYFILRGRSSADAGKITMDQACRSKLALSAGAECDFDIREAGFWGELRWMWSATDPTYRAAGRLGVLSLFLAVVALIPLALPQLAYALEASASLIWPSPPAVPDQVYADFPGFEE
jgi:hypothetical protein